MRDGGGHNGDGNGHLNGDDPFGDPPARRRRFDLEPVPAPALPALPGPTPNGQPPRKRSATRLGNLPPQNIEAEEAVLGAILLDNEVLHDVAAILDAEDFFRDAHQVVYRAIRELYDTGHRVDAVALADELERRGQFRSLGGDDLLADLLGDVPHPLNATYHAAIVREKAIARRLIEAAQMILRECYQQRHTAHDLLEAAERSVFAIGESQTSSAAKSLDDVLPGVLQRITTRGQVGLTGVPTGYTELDQLLGGFEPGQLCLIAARPSMGKTALALNIAERAVLRGLPTLFISLEMGAAELGERLLVGHARVDGYKCRTGKGLGVTEITALGQSLGALHAKPLWIDETPIQSMSQIASAARRFRARHNVGLVVIDYLQLIHSAGDGEKRANRQEHVAAISRRLKVLPRELRIPVLALSQLNRDSEKREDKRPLLSDLRESGALEQDADLVMFLHRPEYYDPNEQPGTAELIVAKNRNGRTGTVKLTFLKHLSRFEDHHTDPFAGEPAF